MNSTITTFRKSRLLLQPMAGTLAVLISLAISSFAAEPLPGKGFSSTENAAQAIAKAAKEKDRTALRAIFGPTFEELQATDKVQGDDELEKFAAAFDERHRLVRESDTRETLEVGAGDPWPFPVPLVKQDGQWFFDTKAGKEEILNRRIGRNELSALSTVRVYVDAQREYASKDRDGDEVLEYAQRILSSPGKKDGLYWPPELGGEFSPLGPLVAGAQAEGYASGDGQKTGPQPFHGYCFKILTAQGEYAPGGKYNYIINGNMIGGFALVAWPVDYDNSGVMTFIVNQQGKVYQKDLGKDTPTIASALKEYDPDSTWALSHE